MDRRRLARLGVVAAAGALLSGCTSSAEKPETPGLEARGTVLTTVKPTRQDLTNQLSLAGKVEIDPVFGVVAPVSGEIRYVNRQPSAKPATEPLWVGSVWRGGAPNHGEPPSSRRTPACRQPLNLPSGRHPAHEYASAGATVIPR